MSKNVRTTWAEFQSLSKAHSFTITDKLVHFQLTHYSWPICSPGRKSISRKDVKNLYWSRKLEEITCPECAIRKIQEYQGYVKCLRKTAGLDYKL